MFKIGSVSTLFAVGLFCQPLPGIAAELEEPHFNGRVQEIVSESSTWEKNAVILRETTRFDDRGRIIETKTVYLWSRDGETQSDPPSIGRWFYDERDRHIRTVYNGIMDMVLIFSYDERGKRSAQTSYEKDGAMSMIFKYSYDAEGNEIEVKVLKGNGQLVKRFFHEYDTAHRLTRIMGFGEDGSVEYQVKNQYENEGLLKLSLIYDGTGALDKKVVTSYLKGGLINEEVGYKSDGTVSSKTSYSYEYDHRGNWTKRTSTQVVTKADAVSSELPNITRRTFKYY